LPDFVICGEGCYETQAKKTPIGAEGLYKDLRVVSSEKVTTTWMKRTTMSRTRESYQKLDLTSRMQ
jgi:hypothetical protein